MSRRKLYLAVLISVVIAVLVCFWIYGQKSVDHSLANTPKPLVVVASGQQAAAKTASASAPLSPADLKAMKQGQIEREKRVWDLLLLTPIDFYGKVIDEKGAPVTGANLDVSFADSAWTGNTKLQKTSDADGLFHLKGHGLGVVVMASKDGYYRVKESDGRFGYSKMIGKPDTHTNPGNPGILVLRKMGRTEPLVEVEGNFRVSSSGIPLTVDLATGRKGSGSQEIVVEAWISPGPQNPNSNQPYDWHCRVSAPGGGLIEREENFNFEAPESGYQAAQEINAPASLGSSWRSQITKNYFVKLEYGTYARVEFTMTAEGDRFFTIHSYLNPKQGRRNLEFDPNQK